MRPLLDPDLIPHPFGLAEDHPAVDGELHQHGRPQLLYAVEGSLRLIAADRLALLPPQRAAWIPAGLPHRVVASQPFRLRTVYVLPEAEPTALRVMEAPPLLREMAAQAGAWGPEPPDRPEVAPFFRALRALVEAWAAADLPLTLPAAQTPALRRALEGALARLDRPLPLPQVARAAGLSVRSLQRRALDELGMPLQRWWVRARMLRATELLAQPQHSIGDVAFLCGYQGPAAFARVFHQLFGCAPSAWRRFDESGQILAGKIGKDRGSR